MHPAIHHIDTWNPPHTQSRAESTDRLGGQLDDPRLRRIHRHLVKRSAIETRHTCIPFDGSHPLFQPDANGKWRNPPTGERNRIFREVSQTASVDLARRALDGSPFAADEITHVITASCTGFYNPGPDYEIVRGLGLPASTQRFHLGFMGCYAAFPALRMAKSFCDSDPNAVVLVQCLELCSLHVQLDTEDLDAMVSATLFSDGGGCALVSARDPAPGVRALRLDRFATALVPAGEGDMAWEIGDHGFEIVLSSYVPHLLHDHVRDAVLPFLGTAGWSVSDIRNWAVHPGGKAILDRIAEALDLPAPALDRSRALLRDFGNMSSATVLFLLRDLLHGTSTGPCASMAFGPGLTVEMGLLEPFTEGAAP